MVSSLEVADNFVPNDADKQESKVHHALVGTVNSTASGAQSQDGGVSAQLFWSYLLNQGEYGTWEIMHPWISSNGASWKWFTVYYASLVAHKNGDLKRSAGLKKAADAEQRNGGSRSASWIKEASAFLLDWRLAAAAAAADGHATHAAMATESFVQTDEEKQRRLNRPLHQKRARDKSKPERLVELWMDSGASENLGPLDEVRANTKNQQDLDKEQVLTADANATPLEVRMRGDLFGKLKVEKGHNKAIDVEFRGVKGLGKWLWSVADLYRKGALVQFAEPALGGSFIQLKTRKRKYRLSLSATSTLELWWTLMIRQRCRIGKSKSAIF